MLFRRWEEGIEFIDDETGVMVDIPSNRQHWDTTILNTQSTEVCAGEDGWLDTLAVWDVAEGEIPDDAAGVGGE